MSVIYYFFIIKNNLILFADVNNWLLVPLEVRNVFSSWACVQSVTKLWHYIKALWIFKSYVHHRNGKFPHLYCFVSIQVSGGLMKAMNAIMADNRIKENEKFSWLLGFLDTMLYIIVSLSCCFGRVQKLPLTGGRNTTGMRAVEKGMSITSMS